MVLCCVSGVFDAWLVFVTCVGGVVVVLDVCVDDVV